MEGMWEALQEALQKALQLQQAPEEGVYKVWDNGKVETAQYKRCAFVC